MRNFKHAATVGIVGLALLIAGCGHDQNLNMNEFNHPAPLNASDDGVGAGGQAMDDAGVIPSYHGPKTDTTNAGGRTTSGMGMSVYSMIGSSGLQEGGVSSHIESRIASQGIEDIDVFVLDDTVLLATAKRGISANQYDELQNKVLSHTEGLSGKGSMYEGTSVRTDATLDNLSKAKQQVEAMFDGQVKVMTAADAKAAELIRRIKSQLSGSAPSERIGEDISSLLELTGR